LEVFRLIQGGDTRNPDSLYDEIRELIAGYGEELLLEYRLEGRPHELLAITADTIDRLKGSGDFRHRRFVRPTPRR
jgi:hypothetical protein